ncbi:hypothetical protein IQ06DRAFT_132181 [Phaeosphaeriaceae sp. SRC1lsM3a]|nr:hypothetical protein IQ06DRAFT_132181 [Stagonospora sp. SRC1lsM3a]
MRVWLVKSRTDVARSTAVCRAKRRFTRIRRTWSPINKAQNAVLVGHTGAGYALLEETAPHASVCCCSCGPRSVQAASRI